MLHNCSEKIRAYYTDVDQLIDWTKAATMKNETRRNKFDDIGTPPNPLLQDGVHGWKQQIIMLKIWYKSGVSSTHLREMGFSCGKPRMLSTTREWQDHWLQSRETTQTFRRWSRKYNHQSTQCWKRTKTLPRLTSSLTVLTLCHT